MVQNHLKLNDDNTECLVISAPQHCTKITETEIQVCNITIEAVPTASSLGVMLDSTLNMEKHVLSLCQSAYHFLKNISSIRENTSLALANRAQAAGHLLHHTVNSKPEPHRIPSRSPFIQQARSLLKSSDNSIKHEAVPSKEVSKPWKEGDSRLHRFLSGPTSRPPGTDFPSKAIVKLNRLCSGVGRFKAQFHEWGQRQTAAAATAALCRQLTTSSMTGPSGGGDLQTAAAADS